MLTLVLGRCASSQKTNLGRCTGAMVPSTYGGFRKMLLFSAQIIWFMAELLTYYFPCFVDYAR